MKAAAAVAAALVVLACAQPAHADGFVSPFVGFNFSGDSGCPHITDCEDKRLNAGVSVGTFNALFGFEAEFGYAKNFFGKAPGIDSSVLTVMGNLAVAPDLAVVRPYVLAGLGLMKTHVSFTSASILTSDNNNLGWDVGGGLIVFVAPHVGIRGDVRYFHSFQDLEALGFTLGDQKLDFGRASAALTFTF